MPSFLNSHAIKKPKTNGVTTTNKTAPRIIKILTIFTSKVKG